MCPFAVDQLACRGVTEGFAVVANLASQVAVCLRHLSILCLFYSFHYVIYPLIGGSIAMICAILTVASFGIVLAQATWRMFLIKIGWLKLPPSELPVNEGYSRFHAFCSLVGAYFPKPRFAFCSAHTKMPDGQGIAAVVTDDEGGFASDDEDDFDWLGSNDASPPPTPVATSASASSLDFSGAGAFPFFATVASKSPSSFEDICNDGDVGFGNSGNDDGVGEESSGNNGSDNVNNHGIGGDSGSGSTGNEGSGEDETPFVLPNGTSDDYDTYESGEEVMQKLAHIYRREKLKVMRSDRERARIIDWLDTEAAIFVVEVMHPDVVLEYRYSSDVGPYGGLQTRWSLHRKEMLVVFGSYAQMYLAWRLRYNPHYQIPHDMAMEFFQNCIDSGFEAVDGNAKYNGNNSLVRLFWPDKTVQIDRLIHVVNLPFNFDVDAQPNGSDTDSCDNSDDDSSGDNSSDMDMSESDDDSALTSKFVAVGDGSDMDISDGSDVESGAKLSGRPRQQQQQQQQHSNIKEVEVAAWAERLDSYCNATVTDEAFHDLFRQIVAGKDDLAKYLHNPKSGATLKRGNLLLDLVFSDQNQVRPSGAVMLPDLPKGMKRKPGWKSQSVGEDMADLLPVATLMVDAATRTSGYSGQLFHDSEPNHDHNRNCQYGQYMYEQMGSDGQHGRYPLKLARLENVAVNVTDFTKYLRCHIDSKDETEDGWDVNVGINIVASKGPGEESDEPAHQKTEAEKLVERLMARPDLSEYERIRAMNIKKRQVDRKICKELHLIQKQYATNKSELDAEMNSRKKNERFADLVRANIGFYCKRSTGLAIEREENDANFQNEVVTFATECQRLDLCPSTLLDFDAEEETVSFPTGDGKSRQNVMRYLSRGETVDNRRTTARSPRLDKNAFYSAHVSDVVRRIVGAGYNPFVDDKTLKEYERREKTFDSTFAVNSELTILPGGKLTMSQIALIDMAYAAVFNSSPITIHDLTERARRRKNDGGKASSNRNNNAVTDEECCGSFCLRILKVAMKEYGGWLIGRDRRCQVTYLPPFAPMRIIQSLRNASDAINLANRTAMATSELVDVLVKDWDNGGMWGAKDLHAQQFISTLSILGVLKDPMHMVSAVFCAANKTTQRLQKRGYISNKQRLRLMDSLKTNMTKAQKDMDPGFPAATEKLIENVVCEFFREVALMEGDDDISEQKWVDCFIEGQYIIFAEEMKRAISLKDAAGNSLLYSLPSSLPDRPPNSKEYFCWWNQHEDGTWVDIPLNHCSTLTMVCSVTKRTLKEAAVGAYGLDLAELLAMASTRNDYRKKQDSKKVKEREGRVNKGSSQQQQKHRPTKWSPAKPKLTKKQYDLLVSIFNKANAKRNADLKLCNAWWVAQEAYLHENGSLSLLARARKDSAVKREDEIGPFCDEDEVNCSGCHGARDDAAAEAEEPTLLCDGCDGEYHLGCVRPSITSVPEGDFYCVNCIGEVNCSGCHGARDDAAAEAEEPTLLCDGCDGEYHLGCVRPSITSVPEGDFYCVDCIGEVNCSGCHGARDDAAAKAEEPTLLCDGCDGEYHLGCVRPSITSVPEGDFYCVNCIGGDEGIFIDSPVVKSTEPDQLSSASKSSADNFNSKEEAGGDALSIVEESLAAYDSKFGTKFGNECTTEDSIGGKDGLTLESSVRRQVLIDEQELRKEAIQFERDEEYCPVDEINQGEGSEKDDYACDASVAYSGLLFYDERTDVAVPAFNTIFEDPHQWKIVCPIRLAGEVLRGCEGLKKNDFDVKYIDLDVGTSVSGACGATVPPSVNKSAEEAAMNRLECFMVDNNMNRRGGDCASLTAIDDVQRDESSKIVTAVQEKSITSSRIQCRRVLRGIESKSIHRKYWEYYVDGHRLCQSVDEAIRYMASHPMPTEKLDSCVPPSEFPNEDENRIDFVEAKIKRLGSGMPKASFLGGSSRMGEAAHLSRTETGSYADMTRVVAVADSIGSDKCTYYIDGGDRRYRRFQSAAAYLKLFPSPFSMRGTALVKPITRLYSAKLRGIGESIVEYSSSDTNKNNLPFPDGYMSGTYHGVRAGGYITAEHAIVACAMNVCRRADPSLLEHRYFRDAPYSNWRVSLRRLTYAPTTEGGKKRSADALADGEEPSPQENADASWKNSLWCQLLRVEGKIYVVSGDRLFYETYSRKSTDEGDVCKKDIAYYWCDSSSLENEEVGDQRNLIGSSYSSLGTRSIDLDAVALRSSTVDVNANAAAASSATGAIPAENKDADADADAGADTDTDADADADTSADADADTSAEADIDKGDVRGEAMAAAKNPPNGAAAAEADNRALSLLQELTEEEEQIVGAIDSIGPPDEVLASSDTHSVQRQSMRKLKPGIWLNDEVLHYFLLTLSRRDAKLSEKDPSRKRCHFFNSFFISKLLDEVGYKYSNVKNHSKKVAGRDIFKLDKIFFPINVGGNHWTVAVACMQEKKIQYYDSKARDGNRYLQGIMRYLKDEHQAKKGRPLPDADEWELIECTPDTPQQENDFDCGVFCCMFCDFLSLGCPLTFSQEHITRCRKRIALSILKGVAIGWRNDEASEILDVPTAPSAVR